MPSPQVVAQCGFTPPATAYPPYLNVTEWNDGSFCVTVRAPVNATDGTCGATSSITLSRDDFMAWFRDVTDKMLAGAA